MFQHVPSTIGHKRVFDSVFPPSLLSGISPTPDVTPVLGFTPPGEPFGGIQTSIKANKPAPSSEEPVPEQVTWDRAWHTATAFLTIPDKGFNVNSDGNSDDKIGDRTLLKRWARDPPSTAIRDSLFYVGADASGGKGSRKGMKECDLKLWYMSETRRHFLTNFKDTLVKILEHAERKDVLARLVRYLRLVQNIYYTPFLKFILPLSDPTARDTGFTALRESIHAVTTFSLPADKFSVILATELTAACSLILGTKRGRDQPDVSPTEAGDEMDIDSKPSMSYNNWKREPSREKRIVLMTEGELPGSTEARHTLMRLLEGLQDIGLGGSKSQVIFANVMNNMITEFVISSYSGEWEAPSLAVEHLRLWIGNIFGRLAVQVLHCLKPGEHRVQSTEDHLDVTLRDVEKWQEIAITRLASLRISELFDIIVEWDISSGAIEDLKSYTTNPTTRFYLSSTFNTAIFQRLLHPGASTVEILQLYIAIIRALTQLDPRGVLLDRVARPIRRYLRERDDSVKVIVNGLLADVSDGKDHDSSNPETLTELAIELTSARQASLRNDSGELDWDDMNWVPDPIDAAVDYKKSKQSDVIGSLITLFDSKEVFVKELQESLSERLLNKSGNYDQEVSVLELLKVRFGDSALQACEVMLRDALDSKRIDTVIRADKGLDDDPTADIHAKILSRLYWPELQEQAFKMPDEITSLQERYSAGFESLKPSRKLTWLNSLGTATVELDLEDRIFKDEVTTWQAAVIHAFHSAEPSAVSKTVIEISQELDMPASLVRSACLFWQSKRILTQPQPDTFSVLETLPDEEETRASSQQQKQAQPNLEANAAAAAAAAAAKESAEAATMAKMDLYWQFIRGMLRNQGAMPLQRIIMMLKIAVPGGFPFSSEELKQFMGKMVSGGKLEMVSGGNYKII
ncbi:anaphase-promoting complex subunit 2 [Arthroderma uncinatum]|uniref:anaphase-promoting complex subunit 2 n=1 Tax=Arthroderma uncinatum TaxID=74035 RepID=UPI00144A9837|nr:anaphase-promoting complex subunit 2 [Arthroderma uncinatum]KAF3480368.1 anaphase-promoting complex subunit 2 [Arthroderma uncinatum]